MAEPAPLVVDGQTIRPRWDWSAAYRAEARAAIRACGRLLPDDIRAAEQAYVLWYAERRGLRCITAAEIAAVRAGIVAEQSIEDSGSDAGPRPTLGVSSQPERLTAGSPTLSAVDFRV